MPEQVELTETIMEKHAEHKHSVRFSTKENGVPIDNVYVSRSLQGIDKARKVAVTVRIIE